MWFCCRENLRATSFIPWASVSSPLKMGVTAPALPNVLLLGPKHGIWDIRQPPDPVRELSPTNAQVEHSQVEEGVFVEGTAKHKRCCRRSFPDLNGCNRREASGCSVQVVRVWRCLVSCHMVFQGMWTHWPLATGLLHMPRLSPVLSAKSTKGEQWSR